jgi:hypothetical protein
MASLTYYASDSFELQRDTLSHLTVNLSKFDRSKGKAFSYFSVAARNFVIQFSKHNYRSLHLFSSLNCLNQDDEEFSPTDLLIKELPDTYAEEVNTFQREAFKEMFHYFTEERPLTGYNLELLKQTRKMLNGELTFTPRKTPGSPYLFDAIAEAMRANGIRVSRFHCSSVAERLRKLCLRWLKTKGIIPSERNHYRNLGELTKCLRLREKEKF